jgi:hypothetical protein
MVIDVTVSWRKIFGFGGWWLVVDGWSVLMVVLSWRKYPWWGKDVDM